MLKKLILFLLCFLALASYSCAEYYAVLICPYHEDWPYSEQVMWHDTFLMWEMLFNLGWNDDKIFVLFDEGEDWDYYETNPWYTVEYHDYDEEPWEIDIITDYSAYLADVQYVFNNIINPYMTEDDFLFVWTFDHGYYENGHSYLMLEQGGEIRDDVFAILMPDDYETKVFWMAQCASGGFIDDLQGYSTIILTSAGTGSAEDCDYVNCDGDPPNVDPFEKEKFPESYGDEFEHTEFINRNRLYLT